jgi:hypothetical protein
MSYGSLEAQQAFQNPNNNAMQNQAAAGNANLQRMQNAMRIRQQRALQNMNQPRPENGQFQDGQFHDGQFVDENGFPLDSSGMMGGGGYAAGGGGGVVTAEQGLAMGLAEGMRGVGQMNKDTAHANLLQEQAREQALQNQYNYVDNYFAAREMNRQQRAFERGPTPTQEDILRYSQARAPERLSLAALDRQTGAIHWPAALRRPEFDEHRARLEQVFQARSAYNSGLGSESYLEIQDETARTLATLQNMIREMDPMAYVQAKKFVAGLGYEGRFVAGTDRVARR